MQVYCWMTGEGDQESRLKANINLGHVSANSNNFAVPAKQLKPLHQNVKMITFSISTLA